MEKRAIAYTRVSSQRQVDEGNSLETQRKMILEYARRNGYIVTKFFVEEGESAKTADRTQLQAMLRYALEHRNEIGTLIIYKTDRLSRSIRDYYKIKECLEVCGIRICSVVEPFNDDISGHALEGVFALFAQIDNENRTKICKGGMIEATKEGRFTRPAPRGYVNGKDANNKPNIVLSSNLKLVQILASSWSLIDCGLSCAEARAEVNKRLKEIDEKPITKQTFSNMIHNEIYIGVVHAFGLTVSSPTIPHLVDDDLFYRVQAILSKEKKKGRRYSIHNPEFPLRGIIYCSNCGHRMTASSPKGRSRHYPKYCCQYCRGNNAANYDTDTVHTHFDAYIANIGLEEGIEDALGLAIRLNMDKTKNDNEMLVKKYTAMLEKAQKNREILGEKLINGAISDTSAKMLFNKYDRDEMIAKSELAALKTQDDDAEDLLEFGMKKLRNIKQTLREIKNPEIRFRFHKWLFPEGLMYDGKNFGTAKMPLIFRVKKNTLSGILTQKSNVVVTTGLEPVTRGSSGRCSTN